jgi:predicted TIM-barrel fold metal-dependent hydrolase
MSVVIDVDAHFEPGNDWLIPYPELAAKLPKIDMTHVATDSIVGDLLLDAPTAQRPSLESLMPPGVQLMFGQEKLDERRRRDELGECQQLPVANASARLKWMDEQRIDIQNVICLSAMAWTKAVKDLALRQELVRTCNTWLSDICVNSGGRLLPVSCLEFTDHDFAVAELKRMRERGSRMFLIPAHPVNGVSPVHPSWDRLWSAATDLGMVAMHHIGDGAARFVPGWWNIGGDTTVLRQIGSSHFHTGPMTLLYSMVYGGVFERHPKLTVIVAEVGVGWLPYLYWDIDHVLSDHAKLLLGEWTLPLKPSEYLVRNVRGTPLTGAMNGGDRELVQIMNLLPEDMVVFSSDFPHFEGLSSPSTYYKAKLAAVPTSRLNRFYGGSIADVYSRMGDPICSASFGQ